MESEPGKPDVIIYYPTRQLYRMMPHPLDNNFTIGPHVYVWENGPFYQRTYGCEVVTMTGRTDISLTLIEREISGDELIRKLSGLMSNTSAKGDQTSLYAETKGALTILNRAAKYSSGRKVIFPHDYFYNDLLCATFPHYDHKYQTALCRWDETTGRLVVYWEENGLQVANGQAAP